MERNNVSTDLRFNQALAALQAGKLREAEQNLREVIDAAPAHAGALNVLAIVLTRARRFAEAEGVFQQAIAQGAASDATFYNYAAVLQALKRPEDALAQLDRALALNPNVAETWNNRGVVLNELARHEEAVAAFEKALALKRDYAAAWVNKAKSLLELRDESGAFAAYERAAELQPALTAAWIGRGNVLLLRDRADEALASFEKAVALDPRAAEAWRGCAEAKALNKQYEAALVAYDRALALDSRLARAWLGRAGVLIELGRFEEAFAAIDRAEGGGDNQRAWLTRAIALSRLGRSEEAVAGFQKFLRAAPDNAKAWIWLANAYASLRSFGEAATAYRNALRLQPHADYLAGQHLHAKMQLCDWSNFEPERLALLQGMEQGRRVAYPFDVLAISDSAAVQLRCAELYLAGQSMPAPLPRASAGASQGRIRIAYVSADFREHPTAYLTAGLFESHDKTRFETIGVSVGAPSATPAANRVKAALEHFIEASSWPDAKIGEAVRDREVDILVDLMGFTLGSRFKVLALRPAPIQVSYLGYPATTGAPFIDYLIADRIVIPQERAAFYSEKIVYMPESFQVSDPPKRVMDLPSRAIEGLPPELFVFCCFNTNYKITPQVFELWMKILSRAEGSVLWLYAESELAIDHLRRAALEQGVAPERLIFARRALYSEHRARLALADLFLDTLPFNAGATASDVLRAGVPIVTRTGEAFASRMAASLLTAVGLPELITESAEAYETLAVELACDRAKMAAIREKLAANLASAPLFDTARFTRHLEHAFVHMVERHRRGEPPETFHVDPLP